MSKPTYYVDADAERGGDGSEERPFKTFAAFAAFAEQPCIVIVKPGLYPEPLHVEAGTEVVTPEGDYEVIGDKSIDVQSAIRIDVVPERENESLAWVHSHGMERFGKPELEIRAVPRLLQASAASLINKVGDYLLNEDAEVKLGEVMDVGPMTLVYFARGEPLCDDEANHYQNERWLLMHPGDAHEKWAPLFCECCNDETTARLMAEVGITGESSDEEVDEAYQLLVDAGMLIRLPTQQGQPTRYVPTESALARIGSGPHELN